MDEPNSPYAKQYQKAPAHLEAHFCLLQQM